MTAYYEMKNLNEDNTTILIGNPGCGKTTYLISDLESRVKNGLDLNEIGFWSFSNAAVDEAATRAYKALDSEEKSESLKEQKIKLPNFRTMHSMAFQLLNLSPDNLLSDSNLEDFGKAIGMKFNQKTRGSSYGQIRLTQADKMLQVINVARLMDMNLKDYLIRNNIHEFPIVLMEELATMYANHKIINGLYDYTDMLLLAKTADIEFPRLKIGYIDEAQDLATLQWILADRQAEFLDEVIIAGDDKQSINKFSGADVDTFLHIPGKVRSLEQSYRVPKKVWNLANKIVAKHMVQYRKEGSNWKPRDEEGGVYPIDALPYRSVLNGESWLILTRANYQLEPIIRDLINGCQEAVPFTVNGALPVEEGIFKSAIFLEEHHKKGINPADELIFYNEESESNRRKKMARIVMLKKYMRLFGGQPWEITEEFKEKCGKDWRIALDNLPFGTIRYVQRLLDRYKEEGTAMFHNSKIKLMSMHAAKGREADNVVVLLDAPKSVQDSIRQAQDDTEAKVVYVAVTRAKRKLYLWKCNKNAFGLDYYLK